MLVVLAYLQGDHLNMAVFFWYLIKSDFCAVYALLHVYTGQVSHFLKGTRKTRPCLTGHPLGNRQDDVKQKRRDLPY